MSEEEYFETICHQVFANWFWLKKGEPCSQRWLSKHFYSLYEHIRLTTFFKQKSQINPATINTEKGYNWLPIFENNNCRAGFLYMLPNSEIPLHDHNNCIGISMVLKGEPTISKSHLTVENKNKFTILKPGTFTLKKLKSHNLSFVFPCKNNIHGFSSNHLPALLFNIIFFQEKQQRNYYIPMRDPEKAYNNHQTHFNKWLSYSMMINFFLASSTMAACNLIQTKDYISTEMTKAEIASLKNCSESGNVFFQIQLAELYKSGELIKQNFYEAYYWYLKAAQKGHKEAQFQVAIMLLDGKGVTEDSFEALDWLLLSAQQGHIKAQKMLHYILENPEPLEC